MEQRTLFKVNYYRNGAYFQEYVVAENSQQVEGNYPMGIEWEVIQQNIEVLYDL